MLRNRSRAVTSKQSLMADHHSFQSSLNSQSNKRPISFLFSPRFRALTTNGLAEAEVAITPTSFLDSKPFSPICNFISDDILKSPPKHSKGNSESKAISTQGLIDVLTDNKTIEENPSKPNNKNVFFGNKLRVQLSAMPVSNPCPSPCPSQKSPVVERDDVISPGCTSATEMELSEDYTCVISHGANPKTTHIFDDCIIESYCFLSEKSDFSGENNNINFLSFCHTCRKNLEQKNDVYIYRFACLVIFRCMILSCLIIIN